MAPIYAEATNLRTFLVRVYQPAFTRQNITDSLTIHGCEPSAVFPWPVHRVRLSVFRLSCLACHRFHDLLSA